MHAQYHPGLSVTSSQTGLQELQTGNSLILSIPESSNDMDTQFAWTKNGRLIDAVTGSALRIDDLEATDSGTYRAVPAEGESSNTLTTRIQVGSQDHRLFPLQLLGWNADVVVDADSVKEDNFGFDYTFWTWFEAGWQGHPDGLPTGRRFSSESNPDILYELQSAPAANCLYLTRPEAWEGKYETKGTLSLKAPAKLKQLAILACSAGGGGDGSVMLHFEDGSSRRMQYSAKDWWTNDERSTPFGISGLGRTSAQPGEEVYHSGRDFGFGLYETVIDLVALDLSDLRLLSLEFTQPEFVGGTGIFAISGEFAESQPVTLELGYHVKWPNLSEDLRLETAPTATGPWTPYSGTIGNLSGQRAALMDLSAQSTLFRLIPND